MRKRNAIDVRQIYWPLWICAWFFLYGFTITSQWAIVFLCAAGLVGVLTVHRINKLETLDILLLLLLVTPWLSVLNSADRYHSASIAFAFIPAALIYCLVRFLAPVKEYIILGLALTPPIFSSLWAFQWWSAKCARPTNCVDALNSSYLLVPNDVTLLVALSCFSLCGFSILSKRSHACLLVIISILPALVTAIWLESRTALAGGFSALLFFFIFSRRRISLRLVLFSGLCLLAVLILNWSGALTRIPLWIHGLQLWRESPFFGIGPGGFVFQPAAATIAITDEPSIGFLDVRFTPWLHNLYIEALVERGVVGLCLLCSLLLGFYHQIFGALGNSEKDERKHQTLGVGSAFTVLCVAGLMDLSMSRLWMPVLFSLIAYFALSQTTTSVSIGESPDG